MELQPQPTFEFIAFLYHIIKVWSENQITTGINRVNNILSILEEQPNAKLKMNIKVDGKNFEFENSLFIHSMLEFYSSHEQISHYLVERENKRIRERTIQYSLVKTLLDYLPIKIKKPEDVNLYKQKETLDCVSYIFVNC